MLNAAKYISENYGCTLSSAIVSNLAKGYDLSTSIQKAKDYIIKNKSKVLKNLVL